MQRCKCKTHFKQHSYATTTTATFASATITAASAKAFLPIEWHSFLAFFTKQNAKFAVARAFIWNFIFTVRSQSEFRCAHKNRPVYHISLG